MKAAFAPNTLETTYLYNDKTKKKAYYAFPIKQQTMHIEYWIDMLGHAGFKETDIPTKWKEYWSFWCDKVQPGSRKETGQRIYGIGQPMGVDSSDSFYSFLTFMDAYNVKLVDDNGKLLVDDPKVKAGLIGALTDYTDAYRKGCTPPSSTSVEGSRQQRRLPQQDDGDDAQRDDLDRRQVARRRQQRGAARRSSATTAKKAYYELIRTAGFPSKPDGSQDGLSHRGQDRRGLRGGEEQAAGQGIRRLPAAGGKPDALRRRRRSDAGSRSRTQAQKSAVLAGRPASPVGLQPVSARAP